MFPFCFWTDLVDFIYTSADCIKLRSFFLMFFAKLCQDIYAKVFFIVIIVWDIHKSKQVRPEQVQASFVYNSSLEYVCLNNKSVLLVSAFKFLMQHQVHILFKFLNVVNKENWVNKKLEYFVKFIVFDLFVFETLKGKESCIHKYNILYEIPQSEL